MNSLLALDKEFAPYREFRKKGMMACGASYVGRDAGGGGSSVQGAELGAGNGAHPKHVAHLWRARRVEAQRLVKGRRLLPSRKEGT